MIARIRDYFYRLRGTVTVRRSMARPGVPLEDFSKTLATTAATVEEVAATAQAVLDAMQPIVEIRAALSDPDQLRTLLDLTRSGDKSQFVELARCLGVPPDRVETLWEGTVRRLDWSCVRRSSAVRSHEPGELTGGAST